jgi:hypothetical protein
MKNLATLHLCMYWLAAQGCGGLQAKRQVLNR